MVSVGGAFAPNPVFDDARIATKDAPTPLCLPHRSCSALVGTSVHAEPRQAADRYPNPRSLEGKSQVTLETRPRVGWRLRTGAKLLGGHANENPAG
jgi:hypothetical protein